MKNFYTAGEAQARLGLTKSAFFYLVRKGTIKKVTLPGKKQGMYPKTEIDKFAATIKTLLDQYEQETSVLEPATLDDLPIEYQMDMVLFGRECTTAMDARIERLNNLPNGNFVLRNAGEVVGYVCYYALDNAYAEELASGQTCGTVPIAQFRQFEPGQPLDVHIFVVAVKPGLRPDLERHYGLRLIAGMVEQFKNLGERGVQIENIHARSQTTAGIKLCRKIGMQGTLIDPLRGQWRFSLHLPSSTSLLVEEYKEAYATYQNEHSPS